MAKSNKITKLSKMYDDLQYKSVIISTIRETRRIEDMATKVATVTARIRPEIKEQAEAVLDKLGIPISVLIDTLYRQIILTGGVPYPLTVPKIKTLDSMTKEEFDEMMEKAYQETLRGEGVPLEEAFEEINKDIK